MPIASQVKAEAQPKRNRISRPNTSVKFVVPEGGVEPPRPEGRRILSPLRITV